MKITKNYLKQVIKEETKASANKISVNTSINVSIFSSFEE